MTRWRGHSLWRVLPAVAAAVLVLGVLLDRFASSPPTVADALLPVADKDESEQSFDRLFEEGVSHLRSGAADSAIRAFGRAHHLQPGVPEVHVNLGYAYLTLERFEAAQTAFGAALDLRPAQVNAYYGLAVSLERSGDRAAALGAMRSYVHLSSDQDPFKRKALAAIWEWEHLLATERRQPVARAEDLPADGPPAVLTRLALRNVEDQSISLETYAERTVVLNVWATWCAPCRAELPSLQALSDRLDPSAYAVIGVSVDEDPAFVREYLHDVGVRFPSYLDPSGSQTIALLDVTSYPQTFVIGPDGAIRHRVIGQRDWASPEILALVTGSPGLDAQDEPGIDPDQ